MSIKTKNSSSAKPARMTFTFSKSDELEELVTSLEKRLSGLSKAEIVKLALIELKHTLLLRDKNTLYVEYLSAAQEQALFASQASGVHSTLSSKSDIDTFFSQLDS
jgi:hypothetical protein